MELIKFLIDNIATVAVVIVVLFLIYKSLYPIFSKLIVSKEDINCLNLDINHISQKADNYSTNSKLEMSVLSSNLIEKMRIIQSEIIEKADTKYVSKELDKQREERIDRLEQEVRSMRTTLEEVKTVGEVNATKLDNIIDILNRE